MDGVDRVSVRAHFTATDAADDLLDGRDLEHPLLGKHRHPLGLAERNRGRHGHVDDQIALVEPGGELRTETRKDDRAHAEQRKRQHDRRPALPDKEPDDRAVRNQKQADNPRLAMALVAVSGLAWLRLLGLRRRFLPTPPAEDRQTPRGPAAPPWPGRVWTAHQQVAEHRRLQERVNKRPQHRQRHGVRQWPKRLARHAGEREQRQEHDDDDRDREHDRLADLPTRATDDVQSRLVPLGLAQMTVHVLDHHDRAVDHHADRDRQPAQAHQVGGDAELVHRDHREQH